MRQGQQQCVPLAVNPNVDCLGQQCPITDKTIKELTVGNRFTLVAHVFVRIDDRVGEVFCSATKLLSTLDFENSTGHRSNSKILNIHWLVLKRDERFSCIHFYQIFQTRRIGNVPRFIPFLNQAFAHFQQNVARQDEFTRVAVQMLRGRPQ